MTRGSVMEYLEAIRERYAKADRKEKGRLLDEAAQVTGRHRKSLIRALRTRPGPSPGKKRPRPRKYGPEAVRGLRAVWEAGDRMCGKRLQPFLAELASALEPHGELVLEAAVRRQVEEMSAATVDRLLKPHRRRGLRRPFGTTKPGSLLKAAISIRTFTEWDEGLPGFLEMDLVAHCGDSTEGFYLNTLSTVDVATGWVECRGVFGKGQERVGGAIHHIGQRQPFPLLGIDSDNGGEFINHKLYDYCRRKGITFTRSRPYKKNDGAHVEQKNWSVVRRLIGYERYSSKEALEQLNRVYRLVGRYVNLFQPVMQLQEKKRHGARVHKVYDTAKTPYRRLLEHGALSGEQGEEMEDLYCRLNPAGPLRQIQREQERLWIMAENNGSTQTLGNNNI